MRYQHRLAHHQRGPGGAAAGAAIGSLSGDAGKGALMGSAAGAVGGALYDTNHNELERRREEERRGR